MFKNYLVFLRVLMGNLDKYFKDQAPYIACKAGCAKCCSNGDYPFSEMELSLLKVGFSELDDKTKDIILTNIEQIKQDKESSDKTPFTYKCPFLINNMCSVYEFRGIICRTFGLIYLKEGAKAQIPFCAYEGLNYSMILNKETNMLDADMMKNKGITVEPKEYNIHYSFLTSDRVAHAFGFNFGKKSSLIDLLSGDRMFTREYFKQK